MLECTWPNQCTKNIPQNLFGVIHLVRTYLTTDFSTPLSMCTPAYILDVTPPFPQLRTYLMDGLFLNRKINNNIRILCSLKKKTRKKIFFSSRAIPIQKYYSTWSQSRYHTLMALLKYTLSLIWVSAFKFPSC